MDISYYEAALQVLRFSQRPLTTREITDIAIKSGLLTPRGKTPDATMSAVLYGRAKGHVEFTKLADPGNGRAKRGSVRWTLREA